MPEHVHVAIVGVDPEPPLRRREPAIDDGAHGEPALTQPEGDRFLLAAIPRIAFDARDQWLTIRQETLAVARSLRPLLDLGLVDIERRLFVLGHEVRSQAACDRLDPDGVLRHRQP